MFVGLRWEETVRPAGTNFSGDTLTNLFNVFTNLLDELKRCFRLLETDCFLLGFCSFDASENERRRVSFRGVRSHRATD